jgi:putative inorganic carbon (HCO3(-)) transporter
VTKDSWRRLAAFEPLAVVTIAPAMLFPTLQRVWIVLLLAPFWIAQRVSRGRWSPGAPLDLPVAALAFLVLVSAWLAIDLRGSLGKIAGVLLGALVYAAGVRWTATRSRLVQLQLVATAAGGLLAMLGLLGTNWFGKFPVLGSLIAHAPRVIRGVPGAEEGFQPNGVAGCLVLFIPLQAAFTTRRLASQAAAHLNAPASAALIRRLHAIVLVLSATTLLLTQSRGAWAGLAIAGLALLAFQNRRGRLLAAAACVAVIGVTIYLGPVHMLDIVARHSGAGIADDVSGRQELWTRAVYAIQDAPLTGVGPNTFRKIVPVLYPTYASDPGDVVHAHNQLLQVGVDLGLPGLIVYLAIWLELAVMLRRIAAGGVDPADRVVAHAIGAGLLAHFLFGLTDAIQLGSKAGVLFWLLVTATAAHHQIVRAAAPRPAAPTD